MTATVIPNEVRDLIIFSASDRRSLAKARDDTMFE